NLGNLYGFGWEEERDCKEFQTLRHQAWTRRTPSAARNLLKSEITFTNRKFAGIILKNLCSSAGFRRKPALANNLDKHVQRGHARAPDKRLQGIPRCCFRSGWRVLP